MKTFLRVNDKSIMFSSNLLDFLFILTVRQAEHDDWFMNQYRTSWEGGLLASTSISFDRTLNTKGEAEIVIKYFEQAREKIAQMQDPIPKDALNEVIDGYSDSSYYGDLDKNRATEGIQEIIDALKIKASLFV